MNNIFSDRISDVPMSFILEFFKVAVATSVISLAEGLPYRLDCPGLIRRLGNDERRLV
jgi:2-aminoadipate transaminase